MAIGSLQQEIRFCRSPDSTTIAYATIGQGPPIVRAAHWLSHLEKDWENPITKPVLCELARHNTLVRYDLRGCGLSDRDVNDMSFEAWLGDLESVVNAAELDRFVLYGPSGGGGIAIAYAARHPERVSRIVLHGAFVRGVRTLPLTSDQLDKIDTVAHLTEIGWGTKNPAFRQVFTSMFIPDGAAEQWNWWNDLQRVSSSGNIAARALQTYQRYDTAHVASLIRCPTLIAHARDDVLVPFQEGRLIASLIPDAQLVPLASRNHVLLQTDPAWEQFFNAFHAFMRAESSHESGYPLAEELHALSTRELEVLDLVARGMDNDQIAARLGLSAKTVRNHITNIFAKLEIYTRAKAVAVAREAGLGVRRLD
ncbi:alpha/beta fold hydrolase [Noviherbaspirillum aerium]|uniref:alpha/beta fold hydrolase n=1 Tax=Noviherbaspirillum aerium TaxID=2588497 RepID=UPI00124E31A6|nr:alpha/beta fold hydrolase [Noviherbaspirillum aerium]